jgi:hypothetical protein
MRRIRIQKPRPRGRNEIEILPLDPRDPDVVRAKALIRAEEVRSRGEDRLIFLPHDDRIHTLGGQRAH